jgi:hypothetical protein
MVALLRRSSIGLTTVTPSSLKFACCRDWRRRRAPEAKVVEDAHREPSPIKLRGNMNMSIYSYLGEYEYLFMLSTT